MIAWSIDPKEAYLTTKGIGKIKAQLAQDIFQNDLLEIYTAQTKTRDELRQESREKLETALAQIEQGSFSDPILEELLARLSHKLKHTKGKKVYASLSLHKLWFYLQAGRKAGTMPGLWEAKYKSGAQI